MVTAQEKLDLVKFRVDKYPHIKLKSELCHTCEEKPCLWVCPAGLYTLCREEVIHRYENCLECGTCYVVCPKGAIEWEYPRGGFGVCFCES